MTTPAEEAARLVEAAQQWLDEASHGEHGGLDTGAPECGICPLCRLAALIRGADPHMVAGVVEQATGMVVMLADTLRGAASRAAEAATAPAASRTSPRHASPPAEPAATRSPEDAARAAAQAAVHVAAQAAAYGVTALRPPTPDPAERADLEADGDGVDGDGVDSEGVESERVEAERDDGGPAAPAATGTDGEPPAGFDARTAEWG